MLIIRVKPGKLPENLKILRRLAGLSQSQVAALMGFRSAATISHYENGTRQVPVELLPKFAKTYDVEFDIVFRRKYVSGTKLQQ